MFPMLLQSSTKRYMGVEVKKNHQLIQLAAKRKEKKREGKGITKQKKKGGHPPIRLCGKVRTQRNTAQGDIKEKGKRKKAKQGHKVIGPSIYPKC